MTDAERGIAMLAVGSACDEFAGGIRNRTKTGAFTTCIYCSQEQWRHWLRELLAETAPKANRFDCAECGTGVAVDDDGCCRTCGVEASIVEEGIAS